MDINSLHVTNQLFITAVAQKLVALKAEYSHSQWIVWANLNAFKRIFDHVVGIPPRLSDEILN